MLRITKVDGQTGSVTLTVEGRIVAAEATLLEREGARLLGAGHQVRLDLAEVDFIDHAGVAMLRKLLALGAEIERTSLTVEGLLTTDKDGTS